MEHEIRKKAIVRYLNSESPKDIYTELKLSERWFFKWLKRFKTGDLHCYKDRSKAPLIRPNKISEEKRQLIVSTRKRLESEPFAQIGVSAIKLELSKLGIDFPSDSAINRVLRQEGLVKKTAYVPKGVEYPYFTEAFTVNNIHQADLMGPRYIKGDGKFYSFNVMDLFSHRVYIGAQRTKDDRQIASSLTRCWKTIGMPDFLKIDSELSFRGSNRYPRSSGLLIRLCL